MLVDIITRKIPSKCILIQDSVEQSGCILLEAFIQSAVDEDRNVVIFCFETPVIELQKNIKGTGSQKVKFYDGFYDHRNWLQCCGKRSGSTEILELGAKCLQQACNSQVSESDTQVVFIDSLSPLIYATDSNNCYTQLHKLCIAGQVVCLVHEDAVPDAQATLNMLHHLATSCLRVCPPSVASQGSPVVEICHSKPGGGILRQTERFMINAEKGVISEKILYGSRNSLSTNSRPPDSSQLPPDLTTFKLDLERGEKQARSKLVLPYIRPIVESVAHDGGGGKVFYQLDAADDWDEEDPDDDLDI